MSSTLTALQRLVGGRSHRAVLLIASALFGLFLSFFLFGAVQAQSFLPPEKAFKVTARPGGEGQGASVDIVFDVAQGYYLYRERFAVDAADSKTVLQPVDIPRGERYYDDNLAQDVERLRGQVVLRVRLAAPVAVARVRVGFQGCADAGLCYPPQTREWSVPLSRDSASTAKPVGSESPGGLGDEAGRWTDRLLGGSLPWTLLGFFGLGVLLAFTPCMLPMLPILSAIVIADTDGVSSRWRSLRLAGAYVAGMAVVYTALGIVAGLTGESLAAALQAPWVIGLFAGLLALAGVAMLGVFHLQLPLVLQQRLLMHSQALAGGRVATVTLMGGLSALLVGPCVAPPLAGALLYLSQTGNWRVGGAALFCMALGMGLPLIALVLTAGRWLPKSGVWMEKVKHVLGWMLLVLALWTLSPLFAAWQLMLAWGAFLLISGVAAGALEPLQLQDGLAQKVFKGLAVLVLLTGVLELVGLAIGGRDVLQPLSGMLAGSAPIDTDTTKKRTDNNLLPFERTSAAALPQLLQHAGQPVMLDFYADWCVSCKEMERFTLSDTRVQAALRNVRWLQVDVTENTPSNKALLKQYGLFGPPAILFFDAAGRELPANRVIGFVRAERFLQGLPSFATTSDPEQPAADEPLFSPAPTTAIDPLGRLNGAALNGSAVNRGALPGIRPPATQNN